MRFFALVLSITASRRTSAPKWEQQKFDFSHFFLISLNLLCTKAPMLSTWHIAHISSYPSDPISLLFSAVPTGHWGAVSAPSLCEEAGVQQLRTASRFTGQRSREICLPSLTGTCQKAGWFPITASPVPRDKFAPENAVTAAVLNGSHVAKAAQSNSENLETVLKNTH